MNNADFDKINITDIAPATYNPRKISNTEYNKLPNSISEFGVISPIIINLKNNHIIGGHQRFDVLYDEYITDGSYEELNLIRGFYNLDLMEDSLYEFIVTDISNVLGAGEHDFACELMIRIAKLLNDEAISTFDSWDNLVDRFMEQVNALSFSLYLDAEKLDELYAHMDHIMSVI